MVMNMTAPDRQQQQDRPEEGRHQLQTRPASERQGSSSYRLSASLTSVTSQASSSSPTQPQHRPGQISLDRAHNLQRTFSNLAPHEFEYYGNQERTNRSRQSITTYQALERAWELALEVEELLEQSDEPPAQ